MNLQTELERVREYLTNVDKRPTNEANTCGKIITPLLLQCGYHHDDIHEQGHDAGGNIPDYTFLPNTPHTWFLEAKAWQSNFTETHVIQATGYPHAQGKRWVVLSNGREWRLYDNYNVQVPPPNRLVATARLGHGTELEDLLTALSKEAVQGGGLEKFVLQTVLSTTLQQELALSTSDVILAIVNALKVKSSISTITPDAVVSYFHALQTNATALPPPVQPSIVPVATPTQAVPASPASPADVLNLLQLAAASAAIKGKKPLLVAFPDGSSRSVSTWRDVTTEIVSWLFPRWKAPVIPFYGNKSKKYYFINTSPVHPTNKPMHNRTINIDSNVYYIDTGKFVRDQLHCLYELCKEVGEAPEGFRVTLQ